MIEFDEVKRKKRMKNSYLMEIQNSSNSRNSIQGSIARWIQKRNPSIETVVDFGAGRCEFANNLKNIEVIAIDCDPKFVGFSDEKVRCIIGSLETLDSLQPYSVDLVYVSNVLEHLEMREAHQFLLKVSRVLKRKNGKLIIIQPNFRYSYKNYFDDITHKTIYTDKSLQTLLEINGFTIIKLHRKFLPYSLQSKLSHLSFLAPIYLQLPIKFLKGQMYIESQLTSEYSSQKQG